MAWFDPGWVTAGASLSDWHFYRVKQCPKKVLRTTARWRPGWPALAFSTAKICFGRQGVSSQHHPPAHSYTRHLSALLRPASDRRVIAML